VSIQLIIPVTILHLSNGRYLLTVLNSDWAPHCETEITMTGSNVVAGAKSRNAPHLSFAAYPANRTAGLQWLSNNGYKVRNFEVEQSNDGVHFEQVAKFFLNLKPHTGKKVSLSSVNHLGNQLIQQGIAKVSTDVISMKLCLHQSRWTKNFH